MLQLKTGARNIGSFYMLPGSSFASAVDLGDRWMVSRGIGHPTKTVATKAEAHDYLSGGPNGSPWDEVPHPLLAALTRILTCVRTKSSI